MTFDEWLDFHRKDIKEKQDCRMSMLPLFASAYDAGVLAGLQKEEICSFEALDIINDLLQACSYTDQMHNVMFKIPLPLVLKAEKLLDEEKYFKRKYCEAGSIDKCNDSKEKEL